ncbi:MAG: indole-3-glycerol phosphate synthase TrpC, partial [Acidobacteriota bacterium]|nr:indole-3-glycerol phosphate synthase TrpC [Acidobacteriota bacterium]
MTETIISPPDGPDLLAAIVAATRCAVSDREARCPAADLESQVATEWDGKQRFETALASTGRFNVIAECKRRSPSRGILCTEYDPARIAASYQTNGAAAVSVLTEPTFFDGSLDHLRSVRAAVTIPVLRKDFIVSRYQLLEAAAARADAVLLIVAALDERELSTLMTEATSLGLGVLVEVHQAGELERAVHAGATVIGVNNRNLRTLEVDLVASRRLIEQMPSETIGVAESGLRASEDL